MRVTSPGLRRRRPRWHTRSAPQIDGELLDAARQVLHDHNIGVAVASPRGIIVFEHLHELGNSDRCIECTARWPCAMERLRLTVTRLDR